jgi:DNA-binding MurR/RpiR family transcriptional regulator
MQMMLAATVERGDVVFVSSLSGNNAEVIKAARIALVEPFLIAK